MNKGFTLIELLIVIAIIGILASVVVVSLGDQTGKASIAKIEAEITQVSSVATAHFSNNENSYVGLCKAAAAASGSGSNAVAAVKIPTLLAIRTSLEAINATPTTNVACEVSSSAWVFAYAPADDLGDTNIGYCVDSVNGLKKYKALPPVAQSPNSYPNFATGKALTLTTVATAGDTSSSRTCRPTA